VKKANWDIDTQRELLLLGTRQKILEVIYTHPGIHFRELERKTNLATGQLEYHLDRLRKAGLITSEKDGRYTRFYPVVEGEEEEVQRILKHLYRSKVREIILYILENGTATAEELRSITGMSPSALSWHMKRLLDDGIVKKKTLARKAVYTLKNPEAAKKALTIHHEGLMDKLADKLAEMWEW